MKIAVPSFGQRLIKFGETLRGKSNVASLDATSELARYQAIIDTISTIMRQYVIEPNPANYALVYRHEVSKEPNLDEAFASLIQSGHAPIGLMAETAGFSEHDLSEIATQACDNLSHLETLIRQSSNDTRGFGDALAGNANSLSQAGGINPAIQSLIDLTKAMIEKTRVAEEELRLRGQAMAGLQMSLAEARIKADTDVLTGLSNRRAFERLLGAAGVRAATSGSPLSLAICDIDHFKVINDTHGHNAGDRVLQFVSTVLEENCGAKAKVSRHGGEEFVLLFEQVSVDEAYEIVDAARRDLCNRRIINKETGQPVGEISFSAGVSELDSRHNLGSLLRTADRALYRAKANGRNCVVVADPRR
jgi:diguanylate cyclase